MVIKLEFGWNMSDELLENLLYFKDFREFRENMPYVVKEDLKRFLEKGRGVYETSFADEVMYDYLRKKILSNCINCLKNNT